MKSEVLYICLLSRVNSYVKTGKFGVWNGIFLTFSKKEDILEKVLLRIFLDGSISWQYTDYFALRAFVILKTKKCHNISAQLGS